MSCGDVFKMEKTVLINIKKRFSGKCMQIVKVVSDSPIILVDGIVNYMPWNWALAILLYLGS
jgi:hypothetical protein